MTLSLSRSGRLGAFALALAYTGITFAAVTTPAPAFAASASNAPFYVAELAVPAAEARTVATGVAWFCEGTTCKAAGGSSRPLRLCRGIARKFGEVKGFTANGEALAEDELAKCNGR